MPRKAESSLVGSIIDEAWEMARLHRCSGCNEAGLVIFQDRRHRVTVAHMPWCAFYRTLVRRHPSLRRPERRG